MIADLPVIGTYVIKVTVRGDDGSQAPTIEEVERAVEDTLVLHVEGGQAAAVRASAERTDV